MDATCYTPLYIPLHHYPWCSGLRPGPCRISCRQNIYFCLIRRLNRQKYHFSSFNNDGGLSLDDKKVLCWQKYRRSRIFVTWGHSTWVIFRVKICIFERSREKSHFSKTKIYFHKNSTPQLLEHIGLQNKKVGVKASFGWLAAVRLMHADITS